MYEGEDFLRSSLTESFVLEPVQNDTLFDIKVTAHTVAGVGPFSEMIQIRTKNNGECIINSHLYKFIELQIFLHLTQIVF